MSVRTFLQDHPRGYLWAWKVFELILPRMGAVFRRLGTERSSNLMRIGEAPLKRLLFGCQMCGQCVLHSTGMTCPMTCPKQLRNGPCGGVRSNGGCEVDAAIECIWVKAVERAARTPNAPDLDRRHPAVDWRLEGMASWVTFALGLDQPPVAAEGEAVSSPHSESRP